MILPNKIVSLEESALSLMPVVLERGPSSTPLADLYEEVADSFESVDQFLLTLDLLFILERIDVDLITGVVSYVSRD
jgi:hypothetical protein